MTNVYAARGASILATEANRARNVSEYKGTRRLQPAITADLTAHTNHGQFDLSRQPMWASQVSEKIVKNTWVAKNERYQTSSPLSEMKSPQEKSEIVSRNFANL
jgi:hypothetical protein